MSGPAPDWIAEVMRGCRSLALTVSKLILRPSALVASGRMVLRKSSSDAGTKSFQRIQCTVDCCANTGARWEARIPAIPAAPEYCRNLRRLIRAILSSSFRVRHATVLLQPRFGAGVGERLGVYQELRPAAGTHRPDRAD